MMKLGVAFGVSVADAVAETDVVIYGSFASDAYARILDVDANTTREVEFATGLGVDLDTRAGLILQNTRHKGVRLLDLDGNELHRSKDWITAGEHVASPQFFGVEKFVTIGTKIPGRNSVATVWSSTSYDALCSCKLNETIRSATFDNLGRRLLTVSKSGVAVWDSQDCGLLFHIADRGNYSAWKLQDIVGFVGRDHIAMLHTDAWIEHFEDDESGPEYKYHWTAADLTFHDASTGKELYTVSAPDPDSFALEPTFSYYSDFRLGTQDHFALHVSPEGSNVAFAYQGRSVQVFDSEGVLLTDFTREEAQWSVWRMAGFDPMGTQVLVDQRETTDGLGPCFAAAYDVASGLQTQSMQYTDVVWSGSKIHFLRNGTRVVANSGCPEHNGGPDGDGVGPCLHVWDFPSGTELAVIKDAERLYAFGTLTVEPASLAVV